MRSGKWWGECEAEREREREREREERRDMKTTHR